MEEDDEDLSALKDPSEKVSMSLIKRTHILNERSFRSVGSFRLTVKRGAIVETNILVCSAVILLHSYFLWGNQFLSPKIWYSFKMNPALTHKRKYPVNLQPGCIFVQGGAVATVF